MTKQYYYLFSDGEYSDYSVGSLYVTEQKLADDVWDKFLEDQSNKREAEQSRLIIAHGERTGVGHIIIERSSYFGVRKTFIEPINYKDFRASEEGKAYQKFRSEMNDDKTFQEMYNMTLVDYTECHGGC
jgi:hypothetical protein